jgi:hypothetical protein
MNNKRWKRFKVRRISVSELTDRLLLINLYLTQCLTAVIGLTVLFFQGRNPLQLFQIPANLSWLYWGGGFAALAIAVDLAVARWVPEPANDDGGINERLFRRRPVWHIVLISVVVAFCEELLFRGAVQHAFGPYWTSIMFAAIHVRYLRHWIPTGLVFAISYGLGWIYEMTGTLWTPIAAHFFIDLTMGLIIRFRRES